MPGEVEIVETSGATVLVAPESSETPQETAVADSAADVAAAAATVAQAAAVSQAIDTAPILGAIAEIIGIVREIDARLIKVEADVFLALGKLDELITLELQEEDEPEAAEIAAAVVAETPSEGSLIAETIPPETVEVIEEPEARRKKARRFI